MYTYQQQAYPKESTIPSDGIPTLNLNIFSFSDLTTIGYLFNNSDPCLSFSTPYIFKNPFIWVGLKTEQT